VDGARRQFRGKGCGIVTTLTDFLAPFYPDPDERIYLRAIKAKGVADASNNRPAMITTSPRNLASETQAYLRDLNKTRGIYFVVNSGGDRDRDISRSNAAFCESDDLSLTEQHAQLDDSPLAPSIRVETRKSVHAYWLFDGGCSESDWRDIQLGLIYLFRGDPAIKNP
jgi:putative DNA primase/helicase